MKREWRRKLPGDLDGWKEQRKVKGAHPSLLVSNILTMKLGILKTCPDFLLWFPWYCLIKMFSSLWKVPLLTSFYLLVVKSFLYVLGSLLFPMSSSLAKKFIFFNGLISSSILSDESQNTVYSWKTKVMFISHSSHFPSNLLLLILLPCCLYIRAHALQWLILSSNWSIKESTVSGKNMNFGIIEIWVRILKNTDHPWSWAF